MNIKNPYWDEYQEIDRGIFPDKLEKTFSARERLVKEYTWTITDPDTVDFVAQYAGDKVFDPLAGTGYWGWLLEQKGIDVFTSDLNPPDVEKNRYHGRIKKCWREVLKLDACDAIDKYSDKDQTLLLSWPPPNCDLGGIIASFFPGDRIIYVGEWEYGCCGDYTLFAELNCNWIVKDTHQPEKWMNWLHDYVYILDRKK